MPVVNANPHLFCFQGVSVCLRAAGEFLICMLRATHPSESAQSSKDTPTNPGRVLPFWRSKDLDSHVLNGQSLNFVQESVAEALGQGGAARQDNVSEQRLAEVHVRSADGVDDDLVYAWIFQADDFWVEENLGCSETFWANLEERTKSVW